MSRFYLEKDLYWYWVDTDTTQEWKASSPRFNSKKDCQKVLSYIEKLLSKQTNFDNQDIYWFGVILADALEIFCH